MVPTGALIAQFTTQRFAKFKPRFGRAVLSTVVAYVVANVVGLALVLLGSAPAELRGLQLLCFGVALACSHSYFLPTKPTDHFTGGKAILVAICQVIGAILAVLLLLGLGLLVKRLVT